MCTDKGKQTEYPGYQNFLEDCVCRVLIILVPYINVNAVVIGYNMGKILGFIITFLKIVIIIIFIDLFSWKIVLYSFIVYHVHMNIVTVG